MQMIGAHAHERDFSHKSGLPGATFMKSQASQLINPYISNLPRLPAIATPWDVDCGQTYWPLFFLAIVISLSPFPDLSNLILIDRSMQPISNTGYIKNEPTHHAGNGRLRLVGQK